MAPPNAGGTPADSAVVKPDDRISKLRSELKEWEHAFAKAHDGRKPTREETKQDSAIAAKYKEYSKLRAAPSSKTNARTRPSTSGSNSNSGSTIKATDKPPDKPAAAPLAAVAQTPRKNTANSPWGDDADEIYESPLSTARRRQRIFGRRDQVGPTPQRAGRVLGLFDSFGPSDIMDSPTRLTSAQRQLGTPSKTRASPSAATAKGHGSPSSLATTTTPRKRKLAELAGGRDTVTDLDAPDPFATPVALRQWRPWQPPADERAGADSSPPVRRPPPMPKRGLSSLLRELREMEEHALDDEEAALRDMEMESEAAAAAPEKSDKKPAPLPGLEQVGLLPPLPPGAFVEDAVVDEDNGQGQDQGQAGVHAPRLWKKKGLKRQHRRVIMRPVAAKPSVSGAAPKPDQGRDEDEQSVPSDIEDGQDPVPDPDADPDASESGSDYDDNGDGGDEGAPNPKRPKRQDMATATSDKGGDKEKKRKKKGGVVEKGKEAVKKAVRKIAANAHSRMNFRKLNIKSRGGKGGGGRFGGRGRRR